MLLNSYSMGPNDTVTEQKFVAIVGVVVVLCSIKQLFLLSLYLHFELLCV